MTQAVTLAQTGNQNGTFRNKIINGAMVIDQRNAGSSVTPTAAAYTVDRWQATCAQSSKYSVQRVTDGPAGFTNSLKMTSLSAYTVLTDETFTMRQIIEGYNIADLAYGTADAKPVIISFWVKSSLTGNFSIVLGNGNIGRTYGNMYTINSANTWEYKSVIVPGDTAAAFPVDNSQGLYLIFGLGVHSSRSGTAGSWQASFNYGVTGANSLVGTNGATLQITGVQMEIGTVPTAFELRSYSKELMMCQRYCFQPKPVSGVSMFPSVSENGNAGGGFQTSITFPVTMRSQPSLVTSGSIDATFRLNWVFAGSTAITSISGTHQGSTHNMTWYGVKTNAFQGAGQVSFCECSSAMTYSILFSAEL